MKKVLGLVLELNPFHNGHKYFIDQAIKMINPSVTIAVVSTSFTMRGDVSVIDKFAKTKLCLDYGIDIVLELPFISAINSADYFSAAAVNILKSFQVTDICFGSEAKSIETLQNIATISSSAEYNNILRANLDKGLSYSSASLSTLLSLTDPSLAMSSTLPNNTLGIGYLKAIKDSNITPHIIERIDNMYYDENISKTNIASATSLRKEIGENKEIDNYIPNYTYDFVNSDQVNDEIYKLLQYTFLKNDISNFKNILGVKEGIENRFLSFIDSANYKDFINNVQTKRYSINTIKRLILHILLNTSSQYEGKVNYYLRILGMNNCGMKYLAHLPKNIKQEIITTPKNSTNEFVNLELRATKLYCLLTNKNIYKQEYELIKKTE